MTIFSEACAQLVLTDDNWKLVVSFLHYRGEFRELLNSRQAYRIRTLADGFGRTCDPDLVWDWSHVRDSSDKAVREMARAIRRFVRTRTRKDA